MNFRSLNLVTLAFIAAASTAVAQPIQQSEQALVDQTVEWVSDDATRIQAAMEILQISDEDVATQILISEDPLAGTYKLKSGFGKPRVTVSVTPNADGSYSIERIHDPRWGDTLSLSGTAELRAKKTLTNKSVLTVTFRSEANGAAGNLAALADGLECPEGNANARYKIDGEIGRISGVFYSDESMENTGSYESGWREGVEPLSFMARTKRSAKIISGKVKAKLGLIRDALSARLVSARENGRDAAHDVRDFLRDVRAKARVLGQKIAAGTKRVGHKIADGTKRVGHKIADGTKRVVKNVRNGTADLMDGAADGLHRGAEVVRADD